MQDLWGDMYFITTPVCHGTQVHKADFLKITCLYLDNYFPPTPALALLDLCGLWNPPYWKRTYKYNLLRGQTQTT